MIEIPVIDINGKNLGKLSLHDEVDKVLHNTGVLLVIEYDSRKTEIKAYLH